MRRIYLDYNATAPPRLDVREAVLRAWSETWANPSSVHGDGRRARALLDDAREALGAHTGFHPRDIILTSGATEGANMVLGLCDPDAGGDQERRGVVASRLEHPSIVKKLEALAQKGLQVAWANVGPKGLVERDALEEAAKSLARQNTKMGLLVVQVANHETGVVQNVQGALEIARRHGARVLADASQALGKIAASSWEGVDAIVVAAHKIGGPKGIGAVCVKPELKLPALLRGGAQERGLRPGTQDPGLAAGLTAALGGLQAELSAVEGIGTLRDELEQALMDLGRTWLGEPPVRNGEGPRLAHVSNLSWKSWRGAELAAALDLEGVSVSSGAACSAGTPEPSPVIAAMLGTERALSAVRVSLGTQTNQEDIREVLERWTRVLKRSRHA